MDTILPGYEALEATAHDWLADEFSRGTWAIHRPGWYEHYHAAMRRPEGPVLLAGSDLADGWAGFIDGAIESGLRAGIARVLAEFVSRSGLERVRQRAVELGPADLVGEQVGELDQLDAEPVAQPVALLALRDAARVLGERGVDRASAQLRSRALQRLGEHRDLVLVEARRVEGVDDHGAERRARRR